MSIRKIVSAVALAAVATSTSGCAAMVAGYLIGDGIAKSERTKACHDNLNTVNAARLAKGQESFPDQCGA